MKEMWEFYKEIDVNNYVSIAEACHANFVMRAPRSLFIAYAGARDIIFQYREIIWEIWNVIDRIKNEIEETRNDNRDLNWALFTLKKLDSERCCTCVKYLPEYKKAYFENEEYFGAVAGSPVLFSEAYYSSFFDFAFTALSTELTIFQSLAVCAGADMWEEILYPGCNFPSTSELEAFAKEIPIEEKLSDKVFYDPDYVSPWDTEHHEYICNLSPSDLSESQEILHKGLKNASKLDLQRMEKRFDQAIDELAPAFASLRTQFFKAWKTLPWPAGYETLADRPLTSKEKERLNLGGRPPIYKVLLPEYLAGLGDQWKNAGEYYDYLKKHDTEKLCRNGRMIKKDSFVSGMRRACPKTETTPETKPKDKTPE